MSTPDSGGPPHGLTLFDHAAITAEIAERREAPAAVLARRGLTESAWNDATAYWMQRMLDDAVQNKDQARVVHVYGKAFGDAQDALAPPRPITVEEWADLTAETLAEGDPAGPLAKRSLSAADHQRLVRRFARELAADPDAAARYAQRFAQRAPRTAEA